MYTIPSNNSNSKPPVLRVCHPNTKWAAPLKINNHPNNTVTAIPAAGGTTIASTPAKIISTLSAIDHPSDLRTITGTGVDVTLISNPPKVPAEPKLLFTAGKWVSGQTGFSCSPSLICLLPFTLVRNDHERCLSLAHDPK